MSLNIFTSTVKYGNMLNRTDKSNSDVIKNRKNFLANNGLEVRQTTRVDVIYEGENYCRYIKVGRADGSFGMTLDDMQPCDGLVTKDKNHALFLAIADCIGAVIYDPKQQVLMLSHLGRHSLEKFGGNKSIKFLVKEYSSDPNELVVALSPSASSKNYPLYNFDGRSMQEVAVSQFIDSGVLEKNITTNPTDTTTSEEYYSHSEFLKGHRDDDDRFAVVTMME